MHKKATGQRVGAGGERFPQCCRPGGGKQQPLEKNMKYHLVMSPLHNKRAKPWGKGQQILCPFHFLPGAGENGGREKESHLIPLGKKQETILD